MLSRHINSSSASEISTAFTNREYCSAIFLHVSQAFDRVWIKGLMHQIITLLPENTHMLLEWYRYHRVFCSTIPLLKPSTHIDENRELSIGVSERQIRG